MAWNAVFVFVSSMWVVTSMEGYYQPPRGSSVWGYFTPPVIHREPPHSHQSAMDAMVDLTNNLGIAILQDNTFSRGNFAFSPYGVASVLVVLYEGAQGESARQIHRAVGFPSDKDIIRVGFRDIHRHLRSYFSHEGYLSGISLNKETSSLKPEYKRVLRFYGYDIDLEETQEDDVGLGKPTTEGERNTTTTVSTSPPPGTSPCSTTSKDKDIEKPDSGDLVTQNTTAVENAVKEMNTTTVSTVTTEMATVSPTELVTEAGQTANNDVEPTQQPESQTAGDESPEGNTKPTESVTEAADVGNTKPTESVTEAADVGNTKPTESVTEAADVGNTKPTESVTEAADVGNTKPTESVTEAADVGNTKPTESVIEAADVGSTKPAENEATTHKSPPDDAKPENSATEQTTVAPTNEHTANGVGTTTAKSSTTEEIIKATTTLYTESETNEIPNTTEPVKSQTEFPTPTNESSEGENDKTGKEVSSTGEESTTGNSEKDGNVPHLISEQPPQMTTLDASVTEAVVVAETTVGQIETTEGVKTEEFTNSPLDNGMLIPQSDLVPTTAGENNTQPSQTTNGVFREAGTSETVKRSTDSHPEDTNSLFESQSLGKNIIQMSGNKLTPEQKARIRAIVNSRAPKWLSDIKKPSKSRKGRTITDYLKSPRSPELSLQLQNGMYDTHVSRNADLYRSLPRLLFLVDGAIDTPVPMMTYTNIFPYAYVPKLHAKAMEFPLDDIRYKLLIVLPVERRGLRQLVYDMLDCPLSSILATMKPARVKAIVPTFMVEGFVILTSSLQKLGIWDVFDPRKANLSGMSMDPELYVRNVEQSVTVVIRNYVEILDIRTRTMAARYMDHEFEATHPFLYFVLDTSTNVALMAGQILDPLNSRIY